MLGGVTLESNEKIAFLQSMHIESRKAGKHILCTIDKEAGGIFDDRSSNSRFNEDGHGKY